MDPDKYCYLQIAQKQSSLYYAINLLKNNQKKILSASYALSKKIEEIILRKNITIASYTQLSWWRQQILNINTIQNNNYIIQSLEKHVQQYPRIKEILIQYIDKMENLIEKKYYHNIEDLNNNYWNSNILIYKIFEEINNSNNNKTFELELNKAITMTKIIRNIGRDKLNGNVYIPIEELDNFNIDLDEFLNTKYSEKFINLIDYQIQKTLHIYEETINKYSSEDLKINTFHISITAMYYELLQELKANKRVILENFISLNPFRKFWISWISNIRNGQNLINKIKS
ncbi:phytoene synthase [Candidatus Kinetoplastibacterium desouzaii TCC079E]|uniref:Phytoene synthase n=1 Tax=Candidatus Kinetoplastidibacterium desouzai TCC079E TaxID=1208919 RepID=M1M3D5_9PROT|nr:squalene/phytoene synthase family protein [Candidatus Kinetoplastibacterium desouzaii]AGF46745.1 phytoene synthase [Candidatus Kinetoplastibacterium desouzaii TCC079E]